MCSARGLKNGVKSIKVVSSRSISSDSTAATRSVANIAVPLGALSFAKWIIMRRRRCFLGYFYLLLIIEPPSDYRSLLSLCISRMPSFFDGRRFDVAFRLASLKISRQIRFLRKDS